MGSLRRIVRYRVLRPHILGYKTLIGYSWEAYWNIDVKPGQKGQTLFKLEQVHNSLGKPCLVGFEPRRSSWTF